MLRNTHLGHMEGEPYRKAVNEALDELVRSAPAELREAVEREVAWEAMRWFERATQSTQPRIDPTASEDTRATLELPRKIIPPGNGNGSNGVGQ